MNPGDLVFVHGTSFISRAIRLAEWFQREPHDSHIGDRWNHVAILDRKLPTGEWTVIQAEARGVTQGSRLSSVASLADMEIVELPGQLTRAKVLSFARAQVGKPYGFLTIASILFTLFTPRVLSVLLPGTWICSALAAEAWRFAGWYHPWIDIYQVSPAELYVATQEA